VCAAALGKFENYALGISKPWKPNSLTLLNLGILKSWSLETLEPWNLEILESWRNLGTLETWKLRNFEIKKTRNEETITFSNTGRKIIGKMGNRMQGGESVRWLVIEITSPENRKMIRFCPKLIHVFWSKLNLYPSFCRNSAGNINPKRFLVFDFSSFSRIHHF
jgi:hypothetical protein